jgi:hypothetical protein
LSDAALHLRARAEEQCLISSFPGHRAAAGAFPNAFLGEMYIGSRRQNASNQH